jgi:RNA polymerase sigma-70 factor, ECF subfamily
MSMPFGWHAHDHFQPAGSRFEVDAMATNKPGARSMRGLKPRIVHLRVLGPDAYSEVNTEEAADPDALYRRYAPYVAAIGLRMLGRDGELDDLVQDTFVIALGAITDLRDPAAIKAWLARITVRLAIRRLRHRRWRSLLHLDRDVSDYEALAAPQATPEQRALVARIYRILDTLPAADRAAWVLRHVEGEQLQRIPDLCGCSLSTAQRRLRRAQAVVEKGLSDA